MITSNMDVHVSISISLESPKVVKDLVDTIILYLVTLP